MEQHGSESFFVIGEGLLGESGEGASRPLPSADARRSPRRSASRGMGPKGTGKPARRAQSQEDRRADGGGRRRPGADPGRLHLPRAVHRPRPDVRQDDRHARRRNVSPAELLQGALAEPRPRLPLRRRPGRPGVGEVLRGRRPAPEDGQDARRPDGFAAKDGLRPPARRGHHRGQKRKAIIPDPRNDENLAVAQTHCAMIRFHNRVVDTQLGRVPQAQRSPRPREIVTKHYQWMIRHRLPAADLRRRRRRRRLHQRPQGVRGRARRRRDVPTMPIEFSVAALPARPLDGPRAPTTGTRSSTTAAGTLDFLFDVLGARAATSAAGRACRATGSPTSAASTTSARRTRRPDGAGRTSSTARCGSTRCSSTRSQHLPPGLVRRPGRCRSTTRAATSRSATSTRAKMVHAGDRPADGDAS